MVQDKIYVQYFDDSSMYAKIQGIYKNGNYYASLVRKNFNRKAQKPKAVSINNPNLWKPIGDNSMVPLDVLERYANL